jgi:hypothetical protein
MPEATEQVEQLYCLPMLGVVKQSSEGHALLGVLWKC